VAAGDRTIDSGEVDRFARHAADWWDPESSFRALHRVTPIRIEFIRSRLARHFRRDTSLVSPFRGLRLLDIGCGGGLAAEPMSRLGFDVTGIDAEEGAIATARDHSRAAGLAIDYRIATAGSGNILDERFDVVLALEVIEHVADRDDFMQSVTAHVAPHGAAIIATLNRTLRSFALAIVGAEYLLGWIPLGTHDWRKFVRPSELILGLRRNGLRATDLCGLSYQPGTGNWALSRDLSVNYLVMAVRS
jgi:2-polyprenyl-6-hydroxyphenyl methylase / 3-demethylubiquinone-9 3-methyltransferase